MADAKPSRKSAPKTVNEPVARAAVPVESKVESKPAKPAVVARRAAPAKVSAAAVVKAVPEKTAPKMAPKTIAAEKAGAPKPSAAKSKTVAPQLASKTVAAEPAAPKPVVPASVEAIVPEKNPMSAENPFAKSFESVAPAFEKATADAVAQAQAAQEQFAGKFKELMEKNMKSVTEISEFTKGNVEALIESAKAAAAGAETLTTHMVESTKKATEEAQAAFKTLSASKTPNEFFAAHNEFSKAQFDKAVANMSHLTETWLKLAGEVVQPLSSRVALATETVKKNIAS